MELATLEQVMVGLSDVTPVVHGNVCVNKYKLTVLAFIWQKTVSFWKKN